MEMDSVEAVILTKGAASAVNNSADLWTAALRKLDPLERQEFDVNGTFKLTDLSGILNHMKAKQQDSKDKHWKIRFRGKEHDLYETWGKMIGCVASFTDFIESAARLGSGGGHAALPWGTISFVLRVELPILEASVDREPAN